MVGEEEAFFGAVFEEELFYFFDLEGHQVGKGLVEQGKVGRAADNDIQFDQSSLAAGELPDRSLVRFAEFGELLFEAGGWDLKVVEYPPEGECFWNKIELGQEADEVRMLTGFGDRLVVESYGSACRGEGAVEDLQETGFACAVSAEEAGDGAGSAMEVDVGEDGSGAEGELDGVGGKVVHGECFDA